MCFHLKTSCLVYIVDCLPLSSQPTAPQLVSKQSLSNTYFLHKAHNSLLAHRNTRHFSTMHGGHLNREINHQEKAQKCEKHGTKRTMKRALVYGMRAEPRGSTLLTYLEHVGQALSSLTTLHMHMPVNDAEAPSVLILGSQINFSE